MRHTKNIKNLWCILLLLALSVDITPQAYKMLLAKGTDAWISNVYYT